MAETKLQQVHWQYHFDSFDYVVNLSSKTCKTMAGVTGPDENIVDFGVVNSENNICKLFYL